MDRSEQSVRFGVGRSCERDFQRDKDEKEEEDDKEEVEVEVEEKVEEKVEEQVEEVEEEEMGEWNDKKKGVTKGRIFFNTTTRVGRRNACNGGVGASFVE